MEQLALNLYSVLLVITLVVVSPALLFIPKIRAGILQKLGLISKSFKANLIANKGAIWIHAVSVGEFNGAFPLIQSIKEKYPNVPLLISTTTRAGQILAKQRAQNIAQIIYFPFDLPWVVNTFLSLIEPRLAIICETELWPNFIDLCWKRNIPVFVLNARMSPRSFNRYKLAKSFFGPILKKLAFIGAQSQKEIERYQIIAGADLPIKVIGNLKYDWPALYDTSASNELKSKLGINTNDLVLIAGSTHLEEEQVILDTYTQFLSSPQINKNKKLRVIIVPRHPERFDAVAKIIENASYRARRYSKNEAFSTEKDIYLLDTIGQLGNFYSIASLAFVGGSLAKVGGHNLLEPYLYAVPVVCGPHLFKTKESATILNNEKALFIAADAETIKQKLLELIIDQNSCKQMGEKGQQWLNNNRGAVNRSLIAISSVLDNKSSYIHETNKVEIIKL